jgi:hypothetical protein
MDVAAPHLLCRTHGVSVFLFETPVGASFSIAAVEFLPWFGYLKCTSNEEFPLLSSNKSAYQSSGNVIERIEVTSCNFSKCDQWHNWKL